MKVFGEGTLRDPPGPDKCFCVQQPRRGALMSKIEVSFK